MQCTVSSMVHMNPEVDLLTTCKRCNKTETTMQNGKYNASTTSTLLLQKQGPYNAPTESKGEMKSGSNQPLRSNGTVDRSSERKPSSNSSSSKAKKRNTIPYWGLIFKKKNNEDTGIDFRLNNVLLKGNPNSEAECDLCKKPYNSDLMYICCETCKSKNFVLDENNSFLFNVLAIP